MATKSPEVIKHSRSQVEALVKKHKLSTKQRVVLSRLMVGGQQPPQIAKAMKISVNGVYGHMRRIEKAGVDLSRFRSSNGSSTKPGRAGDPQAGNGFSPGVRGS
jgi:DNA-binding CsgD family transcriptional regulator